MNKTANMIQPCKADLKLKYRILQLKYSKLRLTYYANLIKHHELLIKHHRQSAEFNWHQDTWTDSIHADVSQKP